MIGRTDAVKEPRLIDDLVAALHRGFGLRGGKPDPIKSRSALDRANLPAFGKQPPEVILLMLVAELR